MPPLYQSIPWRLDGFNKISCNSYGVIDVCISLCRFPVCHPAAGQHPGHRKLPLPPAERQLLNDAVAAPLFTQQKRLLIAPDIRNIIFDPFGPVLDLTYTTKK